MTVATDGLYALRGPWIYAIVVLSIVLNVAGNEWGAPRSWHPDELTTRADALFGNRSLNPHFFAYGGLGFYTFTAGAIVPVRLYERAFDRRPAAEDVIAKRLWDERDSVRVIRLARTVSALLGTLVVVLTYWIGTFLWGHAVGTLAALFTAVSGSGVVVAHLATIDTSANFWSWAAVLATLGVWSSGHLRWYVVAGLMVGIAAGVKLDRAMMFVPLLVAHFLRDRTSRGLFVALAVAPIGFIAANPVSLVAPFEFLDGFTRDAFFQFLRPAWNNASSSYLSFADDIRVELGWPLTIVALGATVYWIREALDRNKHRETIWLCSTFLPYYALLGSKQLNSWYVHLFVPALAIFTAAAFIRALSSSTRSIRLVGAGLLLVVIGSALVSSTGYILEFMRDSRYEATKWAATNLPPDATVATSVRGPYIPNRSVAFLEILPDLTGYPGYLFVSEWRARLENNRTYGVVRRAVFGLEAWTDRQRGVSVHRAPYEAWFDAVNAQYSGGTDDQPATTRPLVRPAFVFLTRLNADLVDRLRRHDLGYRLVAEMHPPRSVHARPVFPFLDESVYVFQRERESAFALPVSDGTIR
jgi:hypothetical protein